MHRRSRVSDNHPTTLSTLCRSLGLDWAQVHDLPLQVDLACHVSDPNAFAERIRTVVPLNHFACRPTDGVAVYAGAAMTCGELTLTSTVHTALDIELGEHPFATLALPYAGQTSIRIDRQEWHLRPGSSAVYMPGESYSGRSCSHAGMMLTMPQHGLARTAQAIAGRDGAARSSTVNLQRARVLGDDTPVRAELLQGLRRLISVYNGAALLPTSAIRSLALEDALKRLVVLLLCPELLEESGDDRLMAGLGGNGRQQIFDELVEWILADLTRPLTLTELERRSGYSRRALQYMFHSRFGLGPMQWLREQRLQAVWKRLKDGVPGHTVGAIAHQYGFVSSSSFARRFQSTFGETPSEVLRSAQRRRG